MRGNDQGSQEAAEVWQGCLPQAVAQAATPAVGGWHVNCTSLLQEKPSQELQLNGPAGPLLPAPVMAR